MHWIIDQIRSDIDRYYKDENTGNWGHVVTSWWFLFTLLIAYFAFVLYLGPKMMRNRPPLSISFLIQSYNFLQVIFNIFLFSRWLWFVTNYDSWITLRVETPDNSDFEWIVDTMWYFAMNRTLDLLDTIFFVLRKKQSQVSFLHIYHHLVVIQTTWMAAKYFPGGPPSSFGVVNSFVHAILYGYYFASFCTISKQYAARYKIFVTTIQTIQIMGFAIFYAYILAQHSTLNFPRYVTIYAQFTAMFLTCLFINFYRKTYFKSTKKTN